MATKAKKTLAELLDEAIADRRTGIPTGDRLTRITNLILNDAKKRMRLGNYQNTGPLLDIAKAISSHAMQLLANDLPNGSAFKAVVGPFKPRTLVRDLKRAKALVAVA